MIWPRGMFQCLRGPNENRDEATRVEARGEQAMDMIPLAYTHTYTHNHTWPDAYACVDRKGSLVFGCLYHFVFFKFGLWGE